MELTPFEKNFYMEHPAVRALSPGEVNSWRAEHRIEVSDSRAPKPVRTFLEAAFPEFLIAELEVSGFRTPTPIQSQSWPVAMSGYDLIGLASTGSGKTLGFALPAIVHIMAQDYLQAGDGPIALMLAPTRELALQIKAECDKFGASSQVKNTCVYGGVPKGPQMRDLQQGVEIAIATPGRLLDFLDGGQTNLRRTTCKDPWRPHRLAQHTGATNPGASPLPLCRGPSGSHQAPPPPMPTPLRMLSQISCSTRPIACSTSASSRSSVALSSRQPEAHHLPTKPTPLSPPLQIVHLV